ncbi:MAG: deaminase [Candidatus Pararuminococcus gallinarum]
MVFTAEKTVIGMTGPFGSGCTYISQNVLATMGYEYISLSEILRVTTEKLDAPRTELQDVGNSIRTQNGNDYLAQEAIKQINSSEGTKFVVDSIRNTHEIDALRAEYSNFFLFAVWASHDVRWGRTKDKYSGNGALFDEDDKRDKDEKSESGQQITLCYQMADVIILNESTIHTEETDEYRKLNGITKKYVDLIEKSTRYEPSEMETLMTMAYANSMRSSCSQRKVGALIIDEFGNAFSSGYNEVPSSERPCKNTYGMCYRKFIRNKLDTKLKDAIGDEELTKTVSEIVKRESKMLDYCRALHAEESAIVNMARLSVSANLSKATLYTTTYPCNLCANKIAQVGIKQIVYFEPYPQQEAKDILNVHNVKQTPFEGVTFNGYFRFMEVLR